MDSFRWSRRNGENIVVRYTTSIISISLDGSGRLDSAGLSSWVDRSNSNRASVAPPSLRVADGIVPVVGYRSIVLSRRCSQTRDCNS